MGDAKRRKALGLMPTLHPFEVLLDQKRRHPHRHSHACRRYPSASRSPPPWPSSPRGAHWDQESRTAYVMAGLPQERLITREDVEQIPVPPRRRLVGELAVWQSGVQKTPSDDLKVEGTDNTWLHLRLRQHAFEGQPWSQLSEPENPEEMLGYLFQHPALQLEGEVEGRYTAEQTQGGQLTWTPEPQEELRGALDTLARRWHGETPEEWAQIHAERLAQTLEDLTRPRPTHPRQTRPAPSGPPSSCVSLRRCARFSPRRLTWSGSWRSSPLPRSRLTRWTAARAGWTTPRLTKRRAARSLKILTTWRRSAPPSGPMAGWTGPKTPWTRARPSA